MFNLIEYFSQTISCLVVSSNLFDYYITCFKLLLDIAEAYVDMLSSSVGGGFCIVGYINS